MKYLLLSLITCSSLLLSQEGLKTTQQQIADTKAEIEALQANLKKLEESLPKKIKDEKAALAKQKELEALKVHAALGFVNTAGNTDTTTYSLDTKIQKRFGKHEYTFLGDVEYGSDNNVVTKNKYFVELDYGYGLNEKLYLEYITAYQFDEFSGFDYRAYTGPGLKYKVLNSEVQKLDLSSALLFSSDKKESEESSYNYGSFRAKVDYSWQMFKNLKFEETFTYRTDVTRAEDFFIYSKTGLVSKITDIFSFGINYKIDYVNVPDTGKAKSDRTLSANLIADF